MPTEARQRLAALMLDALDFGGAKQSDPKRKVGQNKDLARGRAQGVTEAGKRVAVNLRKLVREILQETREGKEFEKRDKKTGAVIWKRVRTVDDILESWRGTLNTDEDGGSIALNAKYMSQNKKTDYESRVLSLYKALGGLIAEENADRGQVKRVRREGDMTLAALLGLYTRVAQNLEMIHEHVGGVEDRIEQRKTERARNKDRELLTRAQGIMNEALRELVPQNSLLDGGKNPVGKK
jgi:hypothetical protein